MRQKTIISPVDQDRQEDVRGNREKHINSPNRHTSFSRTSASWRLNAEASVGDSFMVDRKGDRENLKYGENDRSRVPAYYSSNSRAPLGSTNEYTGLSRKQAPLSSLSVRELAKVRGNGRFIPSQGSNSGDPLEVLEASISQDFISFRSSTKRKRRPADPIANTNSSIIFKEPAREAYSSPSSASDSEIDSDNSEDEVKTAQNHIKVRNAELLKRIKSEPTQSSHWLDYIYHQDDWLSSMKYNVSSDPSDEQRRSIADVKLSIYEDAVNSGAIPLEPLLIGMMQEAQHVWSNAKLASKWRDIALRNPNCTNLQLEYINFLQSDFVQSDLDKCKAQYVTYFNLLQTIDSVPKKVEQQVSALLRCSNYLRDMGYLEYAVALWQAIMEFNLFRPLEIKCDKSSGNLRGAIDAFCSFWDSEEPRLGEPRANGWKYCSNRNENHNPDVHKKALSKVSNDPLSHWLYDELAHTISSSHPGRSMDVENDDPYNVVFFSDLEPFIFDVPDAHSAILIDAFLTFVQLPPVSHHIDPIPSAKFSANQYNRVASKSTPVISRSVSKSLLEIRENLLDIEPSISMVEIVQTTETLFYGTQNNWNPMISNVRIKSNTSISEELNFIDLILQKITREKQEMKNLAEYYLAWRTHVSISNEFNFRHEAKSFISSRPGELRLYNAYALGESRRGSRKHSERAFTASIKMSASLEPSLRIERIHLWRSWIWEILRTGEGDPTNVIHTISSEKLQVLDVSETVNEGSKKDFHEVQACLRDMLQFWAAQLDQTFVSTVGELYALTEYVHQSMDIDAALSIFSEVSEIVEEHHGPESCSLELLFQAQAQLIRYHIKQNQVFSPSRLLIVASTFLARFPSNTIFLTLNSMLETRAGIESRIRRLAQVYLDKQNTPPSAAAPVPLTTHALNIEQEIQQAGANSSLGSTTHSVRAAFEKAVQSSAADHSVVIWTSWVLYEAEIASHSLMSASDGNFKPAKEVRDVFYRGWKNLPWSKQYAMLAFWPRLRPHFKSQDLRAIYDFMQEKGMRLHVNPDPHVFD